jgi:Rrf2 family protein
VTSTAPAPVVVTPEGAVRGTVVVLAGRGETTGVYARLGRRLAADGYAVVVPQVTASDAEIADTLAGIEGARILLGSDSGALRAWRLAARGPAPDALVLAALPLGPGAAPRDHDAELAARTACPVHRAVLDADPAFRWGALDPALESALPAPPPALPPLPTLLLHGELDPVAPVSAVRALAGTAELAVVRDGVHDVLNDQFHRIVAARLVTFLEGVVKGAAFLPEPTEVTAAPDAPRGRRAAPLHVPARLDYALRAVTELVGAQAPVPCEDIARARGVPLNSLVNVMIALRRAGLVTSRRGCEGGYLLARAAGEISLADVVLATEGTIATVPPGAPWDDLERAVRDHLAERPVSLLATDPRSQE